MGLTAAAGLALAATLGCDGEQPVKDPSSKVDPAEQQRIATSRRKIDQARELVDLKKYSEARTLLKEAAELAIESHSYDITETAELIDQREAKLWANEAKEIIAGGKCEDALEKLSDQIDRLQSEAFTRELRKLVGTDAEKCASDTIDKMTADAKFAKARAFVNAETTQKVLGPTPWKKLATTLDLTIVESLKFRVQDEIKAKKWEAAVAEIDAAVKANDATEEHGNQALATVREAAAVDLADVCAKAVGRGDAKGTLKNVDAAIKIVRWDAPAEDGTPPAKEKSPPDELLKKRHALATWVEAARLAIKPPKKIEKRWLHGTFALIPPTKADAPSKRDLAQATELWIIGTAKDRALVAEVDPATRDLALLYEKAVGWVSLDRLKSEPTADWIPPDDQLMGFQVWGPFRAPDPLYELGTVVEVKGKDISVKRRSDLQVVKAQRAKLRSGKLVVGMKLTGVCKEKDKVVPIDEVIPPGRSVSFHCGGTEGIKEEVLENLRTKPDLLPISK